MHDAAIAESALDPLHPRVLREHGGDDEVLVFDHSGRRHVKRLGHAEDSVRLADVPSVDKLLVRRLFGEVALRTTLVDPLRDRFDLLIAQADVVGELADLAVGRPGRHSSFGHRVANRRTPIADHLVVGEREGPDFPFAMTLLTAVLQNRQHVAIVARLGRFGRLCDSADVAALDLRLGHRNCSRLQERVDGIGDVGLRRSGPAARDSRIDRRACRGSARFAGHRARRLPEFVRLRTRRPRHCRRPSKRGR